MLKKFFSIAAVAMLFAACEIVEVDVEPVPGPGSGMFTVGASFENNLTKSDISETGVFTWSTGDAINVRSDLNRWNILTIMEQPGQSLGPKFSNANFTTSSFVGSCVSQAAVFPQTVDARIDNETLYIKLPNEIVWNESSLEGLTESTMQADNIMVARFEDGANNLAFKNVGGLFRLTLNNIPVNACKLVFSANQKISGEFAVSTVQENHIDYPVINTSDSYTEGENQVTIKFATVTTEAAKKVFFIPVPVGTYHIGFAVKDANDNVLWEFNSNADNYVARAHMKKMPTLSKITIGGGGEGATNIIVTPTGYSGDVILPNTTSDIQVQMNETAGTISLVYSSADGAQHPANVYLQALGDIAGLNINLPDSHVELTGNGNTVQIITKVTASTTINTFVVDNKVQIGKKENNVPVGGLTISGGSLELSAPVVGPVTVVYDRVAETVNKTADKVSININSAIDDLVVTSASTQSAPDKIYVTLGASSKVNETLSVPETNCNLYIAPGAQAKTVTTRAEDNTIEGKIESINASGESTIVTITENASFVQSTSNAIEASAGATIFVSNSVNTADVEKIEDNSKVDDVEEGNINVVTGEIIAVIGSENFSSLEAAVAAAVAAQEESVTIKILKAGEYTLPENISKNLTFDATVSGVVVNHTGASAVTTITSGKTLTLKNLALNLDNSYYQGFGTSGTGANAGALVMENCSIDGSLSLFGVSTFRSCTFTANDANAGYYNIWAVYSDATFTGCSFTNTNRAVNVYDPACGAVRKTVTFENCSFTASAKKKAAINIHHNPAPVQASGAKFDVVITNCTTSGTWASSVEDTGEPADATVCNSALWMVSDIVNWTNGDITVNVDGTPYVFNAVAKIGNVNYATLAEAVAAAQDGDTITILQDFALTTVSETILGESSTKYNVVISKSITIDGDNHVITASNDKRALGFDGANTQVTIKDLSIKANPTKAKDATLWICNNVNLTLDNVVVDGTSASYSATYNQPITIGSEISGRPTLNIINGSVVKTNNDATAHYDIIVWSPSDINVSNSTLKGYAAVYVKPQATGTIVNVSNSNVESHGYSGISNAFGMFVTESGNNTFTLTSNNYRITAGDQYQVLTELNKTTGNVVKLLGTSTFTPNDPVHGTLTSSWQKYYVNSLYMDDANKELFANYISSECTVVKETSGTYSGLWKITGPTPEVYYYWYTTGNNTDGAYCKLAEPFESSAYIMSDGEFIRLLKNIELSANITVSLSDYLHAGNYFTMLFDDYTIDKGDYSIILPAGLSVKTDKQTTIFTAAEENAKIVETVGNNTYTYTAVASVASIDSDNDTSFYTSIADAVSAAKAGETVKLLRNVETAAQIEVNKVMTLDLNGKTIEYTGSSTLNSGVIMVLRGANLTIKDSGSNGSILSGNNAYAAVAVTKNGETSTADAQLTVQSGTLTGYYYAIVGNGNRHGTNITIEGGSLVGTNGSAIYHPQNGTLTITGGSLSGLETGVELRSGTLTITGGSFEATAENYSCNSNGSGTTTVGAALAIAQHTTNQAIAATISGGSFTGTKKLSISNPENNAFSNVTVTGLNTIFGDSVVVPEGYSWKDNGDGSSSLVPSQTTTGTGQNAQGGMPGENTDPPFHWG